MLKTSASSRLVLILLAGMMASACVAGEEQLKFLFGEWISSSGQPCERNRSCYCVRHSTEKEVPLRFVQAQYCPAQRTDGITEVQFTSWDERGSKVDEGLYRNNKMHGPWISWHPNGAKAAEALYDEGRQIGRFITWHENGQVAVTGEHVDDKPNGVWLYYGREGKFEKRIQWDHGKVVSKDGSS